MKSLTAAQSLVTRVLSKQCRGTGLGRGVPKKTRWGHFGQREQNRRHLVLETVSCLESWDTGTSQGGNGQETSDNDKEEGTHDLKVFTRHARTK